MVVDILGTEYTVTRNTSAIEDMGADQVIRHEVINAFFAESGLIEYGNDEVLVDWMAKQLPKIQETVEKIIKVDYFEEG